MSDSPVFKLQSILHSLNRCWLQTIWIIFTQKNIFRFKNSNWILSQRNGKYRRKYKWNMKSLIMNKWLFSDFKTRQSRWTPAERISAQPSLVISRLNLRKHRWNFDDVQSIVGKKVILLLGSCFLGSIFSEFSEYFFEFFFFSIFPNFPEYFQNFFSIFQNFEYLSRFSEYFFQILCIFPSFSQKKLGYWILGSCFFRLWFKVQIARERSNPPPMGFCAVFIKCTLCYMPLNSISVFLNVHWFSVFLAMRNCISRRPTNCISRRPTNCISRRPR